MALQHLIGQVLDEKYLIDKRLGEGGMGAVYLATHVGTDRPVAVKVITPQFMNQDEFVERFRREAKAAGRLRHPNVVNVTDFGFAAVGRERVAYLVMEYLDGCTLAEILAEDSRLPLLWVVDILDQVCSAVNEAHQMGIIHRDLKPDNIWLEPNRRGGYTVKVLDFGLAKLADSAPFESNEDAAPGDPDSLHEASSLALSVRDEFFEAETIALSGADEEEKTQLLEPRTLDLGNDTLDLGNDTHTGEAATRLQPASVSEDELTYALDDPATTESGKGESGPASGASSGALTRVGSILGTPLYMSPEQCDSKPLDPRSDVYSLGVIGYKMLCGQTPFTGDPYEMMRLHIEAPPPPLREQHKKIPKKVASVVMSALAKKPDDRPASAAAFANALRASADGAGAILRRSFALYSEHFPTFFRISLLVHLPVIALNILFLLDVVLAKKKTLSPTPGMILGGVIMLLLVISSFFASAIISGMSVRIVIQLIVAPLRPLQLRSAFLITKKRLRSMIFAITIVMLRVILGFLLIVPGFLALIYYFLVAPVVMIENKKGRAALKRSKELTRRAMATVIIVILIQFAIPTVVSNVTTWLIERFTINMDRQQISGIVMAIAQMIKTLTNMFLLPLLSIMTAFLYVKARQAGGESLKEAFGDFEEEDTSASKWQLRMRERTSLKTRRATGGTPTP